MASASIILEEPISHRVITSSSQVQDHDLLPSATPSDINVVDYGEPHNKLERVVSSRHEHEHHQHMKSKWQQFVLIASVSGCTFLNSLGNGLLTVGTPTMAKDLGLDKSLELWPAGIFSLTCGCTLLLLGNVADTIGSRRVFLVGCLSYSICSLAIGFIRTGIQLIVMRGLQGVAVAAALPSAVSLLTTNLPSGKSRNIGIATLGAGQPIGYAFGLMIVGILIDSIGWRWGYYISAVINLVVLGAAAWSLPKDKGKVTWSALKDGIDWVGAGLAMGSLGLLSYTLANGATGSNVWRSPIMIACSVLTFVLSACFFYWVHRQETLGKPCIFPLSIWKNRTFAALCLIVFLSYAGFNAITYLCSLFFQDVQHLSAQQTSLRMLPDVVVGIIVNVAVGLLVDRLSAYWIVLGATVLTMTSSILLSIMKERWIYWAAAFPGVALSVISSDALYSVAVLVISSSFPAKTQGLAGGVFNTISQLGNSVGLAVASLIVAAVKSKHSEAFDTSTGNHSSGSHFNATTPQNRIGDADQSSTSLNTGILMESYRAGFWATLGATALACLVSAFMLRRIGIVGLKRD